MAFTLSIIAAYLLGSIPFGLIIARAHGIDLRSIGSGNIGATNVSRALGKRWAYICFLLDMLKGFGPIFLVSGFIFSQTEIAGLVLSLSIGIAAILGHVFPIYLRFKGGKGVATTLGVLLATAWPVGLAAIGTWIATAAIFRYSSLAALIALAAAPAYAWYFATPQHAILAGLLAALAWTRHHENIRRLLKGEESKIGKKKKDA